MNKYKKLFGNTILITVGNFASKILIFLMVPFYTSVLSTDEYGITDLVYTTTNLLYPIFTLLASEAVLRFALDKNNDKQKVFSNAIKMHLGGFVILVLFLPLLRIIPQLYDYKWIFILYYFFITLQTIVSQFSKSISTKCYALGGFLNTLTVVLLNLLFLTVFDMGIYGYLAAYILGSVITTLYLTVRLKLYKYIKFIGNSDKVLLGEMTRYSVPMIPNSICWWLNNSLDRYVLLAFYNASVVGIYSAANKIPSFMTVFSSIFINAWQLSAVDDFGSEGSKKFFGDVYKTYSSLIISLSSVIIFFCTLITKILLNEEYWQAGEFAPILVFAFVFQAMSAFLGTVFTSSRKTSTLFISTMCGGLINLVLNIVLIPKYSSVGAAIATAVSYVVVWFIRYIKSMSIIKFKVNLNKDILSYILIIIEMLLLAVKISHYQIISLVIVVAVLTINIFDIKRLLSYKTLKNAYKKEKHNDN